ncbi:MAG: 5-methyltetrahydropteroyltriglutamate--homocysteine methyltransferase [Halioglobus sp.]|jgi:5-methyltetrahydropteroyltriglutamate--homocysteine methyltransferase
MSKLFPVYEVGSMPKLHARVKAFQGNADNPVSDDDLEQVKTFASRAQIDSKDVVQLLLGQRKDKRKLTPEERKQVADFNALLNLKLQEATGLDYVYDGEARRSEMYRHCAKQVEGFEDYPEMLRSRGPDSWLASICSDTPQLNLDKANMPEVKELEFVKQNAKTTIKVPLDDPYMIANMTGNRFFIEKYKKEFDQDPQKLRYESKRALTLAIAKNVIRPQVEALVEIGANFIQLDIPSATIDLLHLPIMVDGINAVTEGFDNIKFSLHICYPKRVSLIDKSGYELLFPHVLKLNENVNHFSLELANGDQYREDLNVFAKYHPERKFELGVGVVDITLERQTKGLLETPEEVRDRILLSAEILKDPSLVYVAPDCGLRQVSLQRTVDIFDLLVKGAELARRG